MDSSSREQSDSLILGNCVSCQELVRVPARAPAESMVRCPHCSEAFRLSQILDQAVPELEIVDASKNDQPVLPSVDPEVIKEREVFVVPPQLSKGAKRSGRRRRSRSTPVSSGSGDSPERLARKSSRHSKGKPSRSSSSHSHSSASQSSRLPTVARNPTMEIVKVIVGGILAIPIAYLLVLWIFGQDPLNVVPKVENVAPYMVPASLREKSKPVDSNGSNIAPEDPENKQDDDLLVNPKLDPEGVLNPALDESN
jgi:hypothetical protein